MLSVHKRKAWVENKLDVDIQNQWLSHIGDRPEGSLFPRDVGFPWRDPVDGLDEYLSSIHRNYKSKNCYTNVYSDKMLENDLYDTYYIDIDVDMDTQVGEPREVKEKKFNEAIDQAYWETRKIVWQFEQEYDATPRVYFSGGRGFAIYLDFRLIGVDYGAIVKGVKQLLRDADVDMSIVDESVWEKNRISRLPYTLNMNNIRKRNIEPMLCLPVDPHLTTDELLGEIKEPEMHYGVQVDRSTKFARRLMQIGETGNYKDMSVDLEAEIAEDPEKSLNKVKKVMNHAENIRDGRHRIIQFVLVPAMLEAGFRGDHIHEKCREFIEATGATYADYSNYTQNAIERTLEGPRDDAKWHSWSFGRFLMENPDLLKYFREDDSGNRKPARVEGD